jgi:asparagine synthase (glutamine-hydrolysing)
MSGVGGVRAFSTETIATDVLHEMARTLRHRGPDGSSVWVGPDVGLAHTQLTIVGDEHPAQPMLSVDGRWAIALDGVIVNHQHLRTCLDYPFRTQSDAEVVLAGLTLEGISFVERLQGHFAFVAHDLRTATTHLVRDRLGTRPLHYRHIPGGIAFGSEIKALLSTGPAPTVDHRSLDAYLRYRGVPGPDTLFEGVKEVRPAHRVSIMPRGHVEEGRYWTLPESDPDDVWQAGDAIEAVRDGLREAVRSALAAGGPVGAHLTGALDSSLIVAEVQRLLGDEPVHTFSSSFDGRSGDESAWTRRVGSLLGTVHHDVRVHRTDMEDLWSRLTWHREAPVTEPADLAAYVLARAAREHVPVLLSADGGDELFGRHPHHRLTRFAERSAALPSLLRSRVSAPPRDSSEPPSPLRSASDCSAAARPRSASRRRHWAATPPTARSVTTCSTRFLTMSSRAGTGCPWQPRWSSAPS